MSESTKWRIDNNRVYGNGQSYSLPNKVTAEQLHRTLTDLEKTISIEHNITEQYDKITKQVIQLKLSVNILKEEIDKVSEALDELNSYNR